MTRFTDIKSDSWHLAPPSLPKAVLIGTVAGFAGGWAMARFTKLVTSLSGSSPEPLSYSAQEWDVTSRFAEICQTRMLGRKPSMKELKVGATVVHYATAAIAGSVYGAIAQSRRDGSRCSGVLFGIAVWLAGNEFALPALGVIERKDYSLSMRVHALGEHLAYGMTTEMICRQLMPLFFSRRHHQL